VKLLRGGRAVKLAAPLEELPLLARAGTILPLLPADVDTLTSYGRGGGLVHLRDRAGRMTLLAFPRGRSRAEIGPGESVLSARVRGGWRIVVRGKRVRRYSLQASLAALSSPFRPCTVTLGRRALPGRTWSYSRRARVLRASFRARSATLFARRTCAP
jgi:hypothetical protein